LLADRTSTPILSKQKAGLVVAVVTLPQATVAVAVAVVAVVVVACIWYMAP
jgi:hypothetical protein